MTSLRAQSPAFRKALLESERLRIQILLSVLAALMALRVIRTLLAWTPENVSSLFWLSLLAILVAVLELFVLRAIRPAIGTGEDLSNSAWLYNILLVSCAPALLMACFADAS